MRLLTEAWVGLGMWCASVVLGTDFSAPPPTPDQIEADWLLQDAKRGSSSAAGRPVTVQEDAAGGVDGTAPPAGFRLVLDLNGTEHAFTLRELAGTDLYLEAPGSYTTSAGSRYAGVYGGVRLVPLIGR